MQKAYILTQKEVNELQSLSDILMDTSLSIRDNVLNEEEWDRDYSEKWLDKRADLLLKAYVILEGILNNSETQNTLTFFELSK